MKIHSILAAAAFMACGAGAHAQDASPPSSPSCETIRAQIDAKVRAGGVNDFKLSVVGADEPAAGRVVGSCDLGTKKIMYERAGANMGTATSTSSTTSAAGQPAATAPRARSNRVITECKDGSVSTDGTCKP